MALKVTRTTVDLSAFPDLVVIYPGMRVNALRGLKTLVRSGPGIKAAVSARPDGLLLHEDLFFSLWPLHAGMRQYWRDCESLEKWARSTMPHQTWWKDFLRDPGGTGFWRETYFRRGGFEAIYDDIPMAIGMMRFAPNHPARGPMFSARQRIQAGGRLRRSRRLGKVTWAERLLWRRRLTTCCWQTSCSVFPRKTPRLATRTQAEACATIASSERRQASSMLLN